MCHNQLGRRNVKEYQRDALIAEASKAQKKMVGAPVRNSNAKKQMDQNDPFVSKAERSRKKVAKLFGVGEGTVQRAEQFLDGLNAAEEVSPGFKTAILSGDVKAPKSTIAEIRKMEPKSKDPVFQPGLFRYSVFWISASMVSIII